MGKLQSNRTTDDERTANPESANGEALFGGHLRYVLITSFIAIFALIFTMVMILPGTSILRPFAPPAALLSQCTVTVMNGSFWFQPEGAGVWEEGTDGMVLSAGTTIKTDEQSRLLLTFFEGSTITLESKAEVKVEMLDRAADGYRVIRLRQVLGRTWSLVEKMTDVRSRYEIQTPAAYALVRGTYFVVDVKSDGTTYIGVIEGLVAVAVQGKEVAVPAGYELHVSNGMSPSEPTQIAPDAMKEYQRGSAVQGGNHVNDKTIIRSVP